MKPLHSLHRSGRLVITLGLAAIVAAIYGQVARHPFVAFDDIEYLLANSRVAAGLTRDGLAWAFTTFHAANWHPLTWISHMLDAQIFGVADLGAGGHHLVSVGLHALSAVLLFLVLHRTTGHLWTSAVVAALFAVHPLRVESVAWASERKDVLSGLFFMLTLLAYAAYAERPGIGRYAWVLLALAAGLLAKPMLVTVPVILLLLDVWPLGRWRLGHAPASGAPGVAPGMPAPNSSIGGPSGATRVSRSTLVLEKLPLFALCVASSGITIAAQSKAGGVLPLESVSFAWRLVEPPIAYATYLWKTLWPTGLAVLYPHPASLWFEPIGSRIVPAVLCSLFLIAVTAGAVSAVKARPHLTVGWHWFLVMLLPVIGLVQTGAQAWADRYAYLPLIGIYLMFAYGARELSERHLALRVPLTAAACVTLLALGAASWFQVGKWRDSRTLFEHTLRVTRNNWLVHNNLGVLLVQQGHEDEAQRHFEEALRLQPRYAQAHDNLSRLLLRKGRLEEARRHGERAVEIDPSYAQARLDLALVLERQGKLNEARDHLERAVSVRPDWRMARERLARILVQTDELESAAAEFETLARAYSSDPEYAFLTGMSHESLGDSSRAAHWYRRAAELPGAADEMRAKARSFTGSRP